MAFEKFVGLYFNHIIQGTTWKFRSNSKHTCRSFEVWYLKNGMEKLMEYFAILGDAHIWWDNLYLFSKYVTRAAVKM